MCPGECTCSTHLDPRPSCLSTQAMLHSEKWMEPWGHTNVQWPQRGFSSSTMATQAELLPLSTLFGGDAHWPVDPPLTSRKSGPDKGFLRVYHSPNDPTEKWPSCNYFLCRTLISQTLHKIQIFKRPALRLYSFWRNLECFLSPMHCSFSDSFIALLPPLSPQALSVGRPQGLALSIFSCLSIFFSIITA